MTTGEQQVGGTSSTPLRLGIALVVAAALLLAAWRMTGPEPSPVDAGLPKSPPPMTVPVGTSADAPVAQAIEQLKDGDFDAATAAFTTLVAESPEDPVAQTGLILSGWRSDGPLAVEADLSQLFDEQPDSAYVALHLGLVRVLTGANDDAESAFSSAVELGRAEEGDATSLRMARLGDDLLHPDGFRSYVPVLVQPDEVPAADRPALTRLLDDIERDDRVAAAKDGKELEASGDDLARIAGIVGRYEKGKEDATKAELAALAAEPGVTTVARDRSVLHQGLAQLWSGTDSDGGCELLATAARPQVDAATRRLATSISTQLCR